MSHLVSQTASGPDDQSASITYVKINLRSRHGCVRARVTNRLGAVDAGMYVLTLLTPDLPELRYMSLPSVPVDVFHRPLDTRTTYTQGTNGHRLRRHGHVLTCHVPII